MSGGAESRLCELARLVPAIIGSAGFSMVRGAPTKDMSIGTIASLWFLGGAFAGRLWVTLLWVVGSSGLRLPSPGCGGMMFVLSRSAFLTARSHLWILLTHGSCSHGCLWATLRARIALSLLLLALVARSVLTASVVLLFRSVGLLPRLLFVWLKWW